jgi:hypothetical protein
VTARTPFTVTAQDAFGNTVSSFNGTVTFQTTDGQFSPRSLSLSNGTATTTVTCDIARTLVLQAFIPGAQGGSTGVITVSPAAATVSFSAFNPGTVPAGGIFSSTITIKDAYGNGYNGPVTLAASDGQRLNVPAFTMSGGSTFVNFQLFKADTITLTTAAGSLTGTSSAITISPAAMYKLALNNPGSVTAGIPFTVTVTAQDAYGGQKLNVPTFTMAGGSTTAGLVLDVRDGLYLTATAGAFTGSSNLITVS